MRMNIFVVPAIPAFAIGAINLNKSLIDFVAKRINHQKIFPFSKGRKRRRENYNWRSAVSVYQQFHIVIDRGAVPSMIFFVHSGESTFQFKIVARLTELLSVLKVLQVDV